MFPSEEQSWPPSMPQSREPEKSRWRNFLYLFFRPAEFFESFAPDPQPVLVAVLTWLVGITAIFSALERFYVRLDGNPLIPPGEWFIFTQWSTYWIWSAGLGLSAGLALYTLRGLWFRLRLYFSGAENIDPYLARRVFIYAVSILTLPQVVFTLLETVLYPTPLEAWDSADALHIGYLLSFPFFVLASAYVAYRGARTCFQTNPWPSRFWFLVLPGFFYAITFVMMLAAGFLSTLEERPEELSKELQTVDKPLFTLKCPAQWKVSSDGDTDVLIESMQDAPAMISIHVLSQIKDPKTHVQESIEKILDLQAQRAEKTVLREWGSLKGYGVTYTYVQDDITYIATVFSGHNGKSSVIVYTLVDWENFEYLEPGLNRIEKSFRFQNNP